MSGVEDPSAKPQPTANSAVMSVELLDKVSLYAAFMPFIQGGGLFVRTEKKCTLGDEVFLLLKLMDIPEKFTVVGKVVWISPKGAQDGLIAGVGVQFADSGKAVKHKIEAYLAGLVQSERRTDTM